MCSSYYRYGIQGVEGNSGNYMETMRRAIGTFGITGNDQTTKMKYLSDGMRSRVARQDFITYPAYPCMAYPAPHPACA